MVALENVPDDRSEEPEKWGGDGNDGRRALAAP